MVEASDTFLEARHAVIDRCRLVVEVDRTAEPVAPYRSRWRRTNTEIPGTKLEAIRKAVSIVVANDLLLDAAADRDTDRLDARLEALEVELAERDGSDLCERFITASRSLHERIVAAPTTEVEPVYAMARTAEDLLVFVAIELHLVARMLDDQYAPEDPRQLMRLFNASMRPTIGKGLEDWTSERVKPWRTMVIRRGLAWR